jgi:hypothetical protein
MAIQIRKLSSNEAAQVFPRRRRMDLSEYTSALRELKAGDSAELQLAGLSSRAGKRRLGQAAKELGYRVKWARANEGDRLYFQVVASAPRRRGRPRKSA